MSRFSQISTGQMADGTFLGTFSGNNKNGAFSARYDLFLIQKAWERGCDFEDLADGFGEGLGTQGGDWSGIRDSSDDATERMFERALNHLFGKEAK